MRRRRPSLSVVFASSLAVVAACGARTGLEVGPCDGGSRACEAPCGLGEQQCVDGVWSDCVVPELRRPCANACGEGVETCDPRRGWGACEVASTVVPCTNACGEGTASCEDGALGPCEVPDTVVACENVCGVGTAPCGAGVLGECLVPPVERPCTTPCGDGIQFCTDGAFGRCFGPVVLPPLLEVRVRDFLASHIDFENVIGSDRGIVARELGPDDKPVYAGITLTTHGRERFDEWYRDVAGVNRGTNIDLTLRGTGGEPELFVFTDTTFFPIDDRLFGNEGRAHNFHFTLEATTDFVYQGGEIFRFRGDDDVFVFINRILAIDLGGVHSTETATVDLDESAEELGLVIGERYPLHLFFAERHTLGSSFTVETTLADPIRCE